MCKYLSNGSATGPTSLQSYQCLGQIILRDLRCCMVYFKSLFRPKGELRFSLQEKSGILPLYTSLDLPPCEEMSVWP